MVKQVEHLVVKQSNRDGGSVEQRGWNRKISDGGKVEHLMVEHLMVEQWNNHDGTVEYLMVK